MLKKLIIGLIILFICVNHVTAVPDMMNYRGKLLESGTPVTGSRNIRFQIFDAPTGGVSKWDSGFKTLDVNNGYYNSSLSGLSASIFTNDFLYLEVEIQGSGVLKPRERLVSVGYAFNADMVAGSNIFPANGNVGIGTINPAQLLHISSANPQAYARITAGPFVNGLNIGIGFGPASGVINLLENLPLRFLVNGSERMRIDNAGNVGIGTPGGGYKLDVSGTGRFTSSVYFPGIGIWNSSGNVGIGTTSPSYKLDVNGTGRFTSSVTFPGNGIWASSGNVGIGTPAPSYKLDVFGTGRFTSSVTFPGNGIWASSGNVGIGTPAPGYKLDVIGDLRISGTPYRSTGDIAWQVPSDKRLKNINRKYQYGLSEISKINPVYFNFKENKKLGLKPDKEYIGLIAQEVQEVIPEAITEEQHGYLTLNSSPVIWAMLNGIKELKTKNDQLKAENNKKIKELELKYKALHLKYSQIEKKLDKIMRNPNK